MPTLYSNIRRIYYQKSVLCPILAIITLFLFCTAFFQLFPTLKDPSQPSKKSASAKNKSQNGMNFELLGPPPQPFIGDLHHAHPHPEIFTIDLIMSGIEQDNKYMLEYIRKHHMYPPSPLNVPYNFSTTKLGKYNGPDPSLNNLVDHVLKILGSKNSLRGVFLEAGANNGEKYSNTVLLERDYEWTGVLVEPQPISLEELYKKNRKSYIFNACLSPYPYPAKLEFNQIKNYSLASHLDGMGNYKTQKKVMVQCLPVYSILKSINISHVDYFSLDVEGVEFEVLKTIPWDKVTFKVITIEIQFMKDRLEVLKFYMKSKGYVFIYKVGKIDYIFASESLEFVKKRDKSLLWNVFGI